MAFQDKIDLIEAGLKAERVSVNEVCRKAGIDRTTWHRWKKGKTAPNTATWDKIKEALPASVKAAA